MAGSTPWEYPLSVVYDLPDLIRRSAELFSDVRIDYHLLHVSTLRYQFGVTLTDKVVFHAVKVQHI